MGATVITWPVSPIGIIEGEDIEVGRSIIMNVDPGVTLNSKLNQICQLMLVKIMKDKYHDAKGQEWSKLTHLEKGYFTYYIFHLATGQLRTQVLNFKNYWKTHPFWKLKNILSQNILWRNKMTFGSFTWFKIELEPWAQIEHFIKFSHTSFWPLHGHKTVLLKLHTLDWKMMMLHILGFLESKREKSRIRLQYVKGKLFMLLSEMVEWNSIFRIDESKKSPVSGNSIHSKIILYLLGFCSIYFPY